MERTPKAEHQQAVAPPATQSVVRRMSAVADESPAVDVESVLSAKAPAAGESTRIRRKGTGGGLPDNVRSGVENLSGHSMDDVKVHTNSDQPAQLQAHAYAQGTDIHVAMQTLEQALPHEAWHVVQQAVGRVAPTLQL